MGDLFRFFSGHGVQLYSDDDALAPVLVRYVETGLRVGDPAIVVATESHRKALSLGLAALGFDVRAERRRGALTLLDAEDTLSAISSSREPDWGLVHSLVGPLIDETLRSGGSGRVRVFGEMVDLLCRRGDLAGAIRLELQWNRLRAARPCSLLCAYDVSACPNHVDLVEAACDTHEQVFLPAHRPHSTEPHPR